MAIKLPQINLPSFIMTTTLNITRIPGRCLTDFKRKPNISKTYPTASRCCRYLPHTSIQDRILRRFQHRWPTNLSLWTATSLDERRFSVPRLLKQSHVTYAQPTSRDSDNDCCRTISDFLRNSITSKTFNWDILPSG